MRRRQFVALVGSGAVAALAGCSGDGGSDGGTPENGDETDGETPENGAETDGETPTATAEATPTPEETPTATPDPTPTPTPEATPTPEPDAVLSGSSGGRTDPVTVEGGMVVVEATYGGRRGFQVTARDPSGENLQRILFNEVGEIEGHVWGGILPAGDWVFDVEAEGEWELRYRQPEIGDGGAPGLPVTREGDERNGVFAVSLDGPARFEGTHEGRGNFVITASGVDDDATREVLNELGEWDGETTYEGSGPTWIYVDAGGAWRLTVDPA
jgi:hypothetical protein